MGPPRRIVASYPPSARHSTNENSSSSNSRSASHADSEEVSTRGLFRRLFACWPLRRNHSSKMNDSELGSARDQYVVVKEKLKITTNPPSTTTEDNSVIEKLVPKVTAEPEYLEVQIQFKIEIPPEYEVASVPLKNTNMAVPAREKDSCYFKGEHELANISYPTG